MYTYIYINIIDGDKAMKQHPTLLQSWEWVPFTLPLFVILNLQAEEMFNNQNKISRDLSTTSNHSFNYLVN